MNPYEILGVEEGASPEEIRAAYRDKAKRFHPDQYTDNPLKELAEEKMKQINEAYDILTKKSETPQSYQAGARSGGGNSRSSAGSNGQFAAEYRRVREAINAKDYQEAERIIKEIPIRDAEWFYLVGLIYFHKGLLDAAQQAFHRAYRMEPNNIEYRRAYETAFHTSESDGYCGPTERSTRTSTRRYSGNSCCADCLGLMCLSFLSPCCID